MDGRAEEGVGDPDNTATAVSILVTDLFDALG